MKNCPICAEKLNKRVCPRCGYDETADFIEYRTLVKPKKKDTDRWKACATAAKPAPKETPAPYVKPAPVKNTAAPVVNTVPEEKPVSASDSGKKKAKLLLSEKFWKITVIVFVFLYAIEYYLTDGMPLLNIISRVGIIISAVMWFLIAFNVFDKKDKPKKSENKRKM